MLETIISVNQMTDYKQEFFFGTFSDTAFFRSEFYKSNFFASKPACFLLTFLYIPGPLI